ncbi:MAG: nucleoside-diphosphate kinase [Bacteroidota bacterium]
MNKEREGCTVETSFYIIKPHGLVFLEEVRAMIESGGLIISESKRLVMPHWAIEIIYSDLPERYRSAVFKPFVNTFVEAGLVVGRNAINTLLQIVGTELDPVDCAPESIRFKFGERKPLMIDGVRCYRNIIHRSRNRAEAKKDVKVFPML